MLQGAVVRIPGHHAFAHRGGSCGFPGGVFSCWLHAFVTGTRKPGKFHLAAGSSNTFTSCLCCVPQLDLDNSRFTSRNLSNCALGPLCGLLSGSWKEEGSRPPLVLRCLLLFLFFISLDVGAYFFLYFLGLYRSLSCLNLMWENNRENLNYWVKDHYLCERAVIHSSFTSSKLIRNCFRPVVECTSQQH